VHGHATQSAHKLATEQSTTGLIQEKQSKVSKAAFAVVLMVRNPKNNKLAKYGTKVRAIFGRDSFKTLKIEKEEDKCSREVFRLSFCKHSISCSVILIFCSLKPCILLSNQKKGRKKWTKKKKKQKKQRRSTKFWFCFN
jgi:hypothetical protein